MKYCKNCRHLIPCTETTHDNNCGHPHNISTRHCAFTEYEVYDNKLEDINKLNDCRWYERKWWKFWIKEKI